MRLLTQIVLLISVVVLVGLTLAGAVFSVMLNDILTRNIGQQALTVAKLAASDDRIVQAFNLPDPSVVIQPLAEKIRIQSGASYVVVGNRHGIRYSHVDPDKIGKEMVGGDNGPALAGESIVSTATGTLGPALRGKTPVLDARGEVIGVVSVGFLLDDVHDRIDDYKWRIYGLALVLLPVGLVGAYLIARRVKKLIFGLEPEEISLLFKEREAILESIRDAIVAVNTDEKIVGMNKRARELLRDHALAVGGTLTHVRLREALKAVAQSASGISNQRVFLDSEMYAMNVAPVLQDHRVQGAVFTFRTEMEIEQLTNEFTQIKAFSDQMRAQNHEYLNKLNTIYGLLALEQYEKAMQLISGEVKERQDIIAFLMTSVKEPLIAACLLGKINRSKELKVNLAIDQESNFSQIPANLDIHAVVTILGNIIDNGMEAARQQGANAEVRISFTDLGNEIVFDIEDNGPGVPPDKETAIFIEGYTSKDGENRGLGLAIVKHALNAIHGQIFIARSPLGGARFTVVIPKNPNHT
ncbi:ATP-binding protein [Cohnella candidum]|uniref:histidine kinase n=1 Tax=Cohnella candidum TaxID=2674991 RepID=A0A3G3JUJ6_9BACL|nr:sensor histidine kinase [Cohnella candidum]AYQ71918.1 sensor histidine kinase [Cohnella candidum]